MGQQQLLLVILVTIIVGIATVVAINVFGSSAENANADAVRQDLLAAATSAQGWYIKPVMMGGGGQTFTAVTLADLGIPFDRLDTFNDDPDTQIRNENGTYVLTPGAQTFTITAHPNTFPTQITMVVNQAATEAADRVVITVTDAESNPSLATD